MNLNDAAMSFRNCHAAAGVGRRMHAVVLVFLLSFVELWTSQAVSVSLSTPEAIQQVQNELHESYAPAVGTLVRQHALLPVDVSIVCSLSSDSRQTMVKSLLSRGTVDSVETTALKMDKEWFVLISELGHSTGVGDDSSLQVDQEVVLRWSLAENGHYNGKASLSFLIPLVNTAEERTLIVSLMEKDSNMNSHARTATRRLANLPSSALPNKGVNHVVSVELSASTTCEFDFVQEIPKTQAHARSGGISSWIMALISFLVLYILPKGSRHRVQKRQALQEMTAACCSDVHDQTVSQDDLDGQTQSVESIPSRESPQGQVFNESPLDNGRPLARPQLSISDASSTPDSHREMIYLPRPPKLVRFPCSFVFTEDEESASTAFGGGSVAFRPEPRPEDAVDAVGNWSHPRQADDAKDGSNHGASASTSEHETPETKLQEDTLASPKISSNAYKSESERREDDCGMISQSITGSTIREGATDTSEDATSPQHMALKSGTTPVNAIGRIDCRSPNPFESGKVFDSAGNELPACIDVNREVGISSTDDEEASQQQMQLPTAVSVAESHLIAESNESGMSKCEERRTRSLENNATADGDATVDANDSRNKDESRDVKRELVHGSDSLRDLSIQHQLGRGRKSKVMEVEHAASGQCYNWLRRLKEHPTRSLTSSSVATDRSHPIDKDPATTASVSAGSTGVVSVDGDSRDAASRAELSCVSTLPPHSASDDDGFPEDLDSMTGVADATKCAGDTARPKRRKRRLNPHGSHCTDEIAQQQSIVTSSLGTHQSKTWRTSRKKAAAAPHEFSQLTAKQVDQGPLSSAAVSKLLVKKERKRPKTSNAETADKALTPLPDVVLSTFLQSFVQQIDAPIDWNFDSLSLERNVTANKNGRGAKTARSRRKGPSTVIEILDNSPSRCSRRSQRPIAGASVPAHRTKPQSDKHGGSKPIAKEMKKRGRASLAPPLHAKTPRDAREVLKNDTGEARLRRRLSY